MPLRVCAQPGCPELTEQARCPAHQPKPWANSQRRERVGKSGWQQQSDAKRILKRYANRCHVCGGPGATEVDHVVPLGEHGPDTDENKRPIHPVPCHRDKTNAEAARARGVK